MIKICKYISKNYILLVICICSRPRLVDEHVLSRCVVMFMTAVVCYNLRDFQRNRFVETVFRFRPEIEIVLCTYLNAIVPLQSDTGHSTVLRITLIKCTCACVCYDNVPIDTTRIKYTPTLTFNK
jgi:hypothetical protein